MIPACRDAGAAPKHAVTKLGCLSFEGPEFRLLSCSRCCVFEVLEVRTTLSVCSRHVATLACGASCRDAGARVRRTVSSCRLHLLPIPTPLVPPPPPPFPSPLPPPASAPPPPPAPPSLPLKNKKHERKIPVAQKPKILQNPQFQQQHLSGLFAFRSWAFFVIDCHCRREVVPYLHVPVPPNTSSTV